MKRKQRGIGEQLFHDVTNSMPGMIFVLSVFWLFVAWILEIMFGVNLFKCEENPMDTIGEVLLFFLCFIILFVGIAIHSRMRGHDNLG